MHSHKAARPAPALAESEPRNSDPLPRAINSVDTPPRIEPQPFPVTLAGRMSPIGYGPENDAWFDALTKPDDETGRTDSKGLSRRIGRDPLSVSTQVLTAAGHPPRSTRRLVSALRTALELDLSEYGLREYRDLRKYCLDCAENSAEVRRCAVVDCPFWPYRMGHNPHNPQRGHNPFASGGRP